jgi:hypothetical protein
LLPHVSKIDSWMPGQLGDKRNAKGRQKQRFQPGIHFLVSQPRRQLRKWETCLMGSISSVACLLALDENIGGETEISKQQ